MTFPPSFGQYMPSTEPRVEPTNTRNNDIYKGAPDADSRELSAVYPLNINIPRLGRYVPFKYVPYKGMYVDNVCNFGLNIYKSRCNESVWRSIPQSDWELLKYYQNYNYFGFAWDKQWRYQRTEYMELPGIYLNGIIFILFNLFGVVIWIYFILSTHVIWRLFVYCFPLFFPKLNHSQKIDSVENAIEFMDLAMRSFHPNGYHKQKPIFSFIVNLYLCVLIFVVIPSSFCKLQSLIHFIAKSLSIKNMLCWIYMIIFAVILVYVCSLRIKWCYLKQQHFGWLINGLSAIPLIVIIKCYTDSIDNDICVLIIEIYFILITSLLHIRKHKANQRKIRKRWKFHRYIVMKYLLYTAIVILLILMRFYTERMYFSVVIMVIAILSYIYIAISIYVTWRMLVFFQPSLFCANRHFPQICRSIYDFIRFIDVAIWSFNRYGKSKDNATIILIPAFYIIALIFILFPSPISTFQSCFHHMIQEDTQITGYGHYFNKGLWINWRQCILFEFIEENGIGYKETAKLQTFLNELID